MLPIENPRLDKKSNFSNAEQKAGHKLVVHLLYNFIENNFYFLQINAGRQALAIDF